jgi:hypothetical protein
MRLALFRNRRTPATLNPVTPFMQKHSTKALAKQPI